MNPEIRKLEADLRLEHWSEVGRRGTALIRLTQLARTGNLEAVFCLGRAAAMHPLERIRHQAQAEVERARPLLEKAFEDDRQDLVEIGRLLGEAELFAGQVREGVAGPMDSWPRLESMASMLAGGWRQAAITYLRELAPAGPYPVQAAMLLIAGRLHELGGIDPEGVELQRAVSQAPPRLKGLLLGEMRRAGIAGPVPRAALELVDEPRWRQQVQQRVDEGDWEGLLRQLDRELPLRAGKLLEVLADWSECPAELRAARRACPPGALSSVCLSGADPVWSPDDRWITRWVGDGSFFLSVPAGEGQRGFSLPRAPEMRGQGVRRAFSQDGSLVAAAWPGTRQVELWETYAGRSRSLRMPDVIRALQPGPAGVLVHTATQLVEVTLTSLEHLASPPPGAELVDGRFWFVNEALYSLDMKRCAVEVGSSRFSMLGEEVLVHGDPGRLIALEDGRELAQLPFAYPLALARLRDGALVLLNARGIEVRERRSAALLLARPCDPERTRLHPAGEHVLHWDGERAWLSSLLEDEPWAELQAEKPPRFSPRGRYAWAQTGRGVRVWPLPAYLPLDQVRPHESWPEGPLWELVAFLVDRRTRHDIELGFHAEDPHGIELGD